MQAPLLYQVGHQHFWLSALRSLFWEQQKALIVSDLHFGKTGHFRKAGIAVPQNVYKEDLQRLISLLHYFHPEQLIVVGDLFHSRANRELDWFKRWRADFPLLHFHLVKGNHDILPKEWYKEADIQVWNENLMIDTFCFTHQHCHNQDYYTFCGHLHPGVVITGPGKQSLRFPCFYFTKDHCIMPAFSKFTGTATVHPTKTDAVFAIVENRVIQLQ